MQLLFKFAGIALIFFASAFAGYFKARSLKEDCERLSALVGSTEKLAEYIRSHGGEIAALTKLCFDSRLVQFNDGAVILSREHLKGEPLKLLQRLFSEIGIMDAETEYKRVKMYASLLEKEYLQSAKKCAELCRLYNTLGILCGAFLCIFFL